MTPVNGGLEGSSLHASTEGRSCELEALVLEVYESGGEIRLFESDASDEGRCRMSVNVFPSELIATWLRLRDNGLGHAAADVEVGEASSAWSRAAAGDGALIDVILVAPDDDRAVGCRGPSTGAIEAGFVPETLSSLSPLAPANGSESAELDDNATS